VDGAADLAVHVQVLADDQPGSVGGNPLDDGRLQAREVLDPLVIGRLGAVVDHGRAPGLLPDGVGVVGVPGQQLDAGRGLGHPAAPADHTRSLAAPDQFVHHRPAERAGPKNHV
jgi:hypothetical protein